MSADLLTRASARLRELAAQVPEVEVRHSVGLWPMLDPITGDVSMDHIFIQPYVARSLANWLDIIHDTGTSSVAYKAAEALARAVLGEEA